MSFHAVKIKKFSRNQSTTYWYILLELSLLTASKYERKVQKGQKTGVRNYC